MRRSFRHLLRKNELCLLLVVVALAGALTVATGEFLTLENVTDMVLTQSFLIIMAMELWIIQRIIGMRKGVFQICNLSLPI